MFDVFVKPLLDVLELLAEWNSTVIDRSGELIRREIITISHQIQHNIKEFQAIRPTISYK